VNLFFIFISILYVCMPFCWHYVSSSVTVCVVRSLRGSNWLCLLLLPDKHTPTNERVDRDDYARVKERLSTYIESDALLRSQLEGSSSEVQIVQARAEKLATHLARVRAKRDLLQECVLKLEQEVWAGRERAERDYAEIMKLQLGLCTLCGVLLSFIPACVCVCVCVCVYVRVCLV
jgi:hypothetical protein